jgi:iron complex transport system ATP-binding protein
VSQIVIDNATLHRGTRKILDGISITVDSGSLVSIVGPNGSGKSSLLKGLAGIWPLTQGTIRIGTKTLADYSRRELAQTVAFVPQDVRMDFAFTVDEIVAMGRYPRRGRFERANADDRRAIEQALVHCDISHLKDRFVTALSGGERQRVAIARSLAAEPENILLDEPTASLDVQHSLDILELCKTLVRPGKTVILATHDLNAVARHASQVALIDSGRIVYFGGPEGVLTANVLDRVFGVNAELLQSSNGHPVYVFHRKQAVP